MFVHCVCLCVCVCHATVPNIWLSTNHVPGLNMVLFSSGFVGFEIYSHHRIGWSSGEPIGCWLIMQRSQQSLVNELQMFEAKNDEN